MVKYERMILQISKIKEIDMKTLIVTGGSLDISWAKDFVRTINAEYIIAADRLYRYAYCYYKCVESRSVSHIYTWGDRYKDGSHIYQYMQYEGCT